jgi:hypothetical protein
METRAITFRKLKSFCAFQDCYCLPYGDPVFTCAKLGYDGDIEHRCNSKNCPVWRKLKKLATTDRNTQGN